MTHSSQFKAVLRELGELWQGRYGSARQWAGLRTRLQEEGRRATINDLWIAAVAAANRLAVVTRHDDFDPIEAVGGPRVVRV